MTTSVTSGQIVVVGAGDTATDLVVFASGTVSVTAGGEADSTIIKNSGTQFVDGGRASGNDRLSRRPRICQIRRHHDFHDG